jgi:cytochrome c oxidase subunit 3
MNQSSHAAAAEHHEHRDDLGAKMGMWLFLFTELLLFGGMFLIYAAYRFQHPDQFKIAAMELSTAMGTLNTVILLTSSLTVAISITALRKGNRFLALLNLFITIVFALAFMVNKFFEWSAKISHGIYPGSEEMLNKPNGEILFYGLYYVMTGLHGLHVIIGVIILSFMFVFIKRGSVNKGNFMKLENSGLYWHLVDLIWIFLFPLFYLIH